MFPRTKNFEEILGTVRYRAVVRFSTEQTSPLHCSPETGYSSTSPENFPKAVEMARQTRCHWSRWFEGGKKSFAWAGQATGKARLMLHFDAFGTSDVLLEF